MKNKIKSRGEMVEIVKGLKAQGKRITFTNGCFDLLHIGHLETFREAKRHGDLLIVGLNSDTSVRALKGHERPFVPEKQRAAMLAALEDVDYVVIFQELDPLAIITELMPDVLLKGEDWGEGRVIGQTVVEEGGGKVIHVPLVREISTSKLIERIRDVGNGRP
jgi:rfaE bifunctional protein nucleotidyltransferase chain/domain